MLTLLERLAAEPLVAVVKTGRCANGASRDAGRVVHAVVGKASHGGPRFDKALCGAVPGRLSAGWNEVEHGTVTCPRCLKKGTCRG